MTRNTEAPGVTVPEASQDLQTGDAGSADAVSVFHYITSAPPGIPQSRCPRLVSWLRCRACQRGYFAAGAPGPQRCPACTGGRLQPVARWDLRTDAAPPGMVQLTIDTLLRGEARV